MMKSKGQSKITMSNNYYTYSYFSFNNLYLPISDVHFIDYNNQKIKLLTVIHS